MTEQYSVFYQQYAKQAEALPPSDLQRHARVSIDNKHDCQSCFTCACKFIYIKRMVYGPLWTLRDYLASRRKHE